MEDREVMNKDEGSITLDELLQQEYTEEEIAQIKKDAKEEGKNYI